MTLVQGIYSYLWEWAPLIVTFGNYHTSEPCRSDVLSRSYCVTFSYRTKKKETWKTKHSISRLFIWELTFCWFLQIHTHSSYLETACFRQFPFFHEMYQSQNGKIVLHNHPEYNKISLWSWWFKLSDGNNWVFDVLVELCITTANDTYHVKHRVQNLIQKY